MKKIITAAAVALILSGCAGQVYNLQNGAEIEPSANIRHHFFLSGLAQEKNIDAAGVCGGIENVAKVESKISPINGVLSWLTFNIYTPKQARVYCVSPMNQ